MIHFCVINIKPFQAFPYLYERDISYKVSFLDTKYILLEYVLRSKSCYTWVSVGEKEMFPTLPGKQHNFCSCIRCHNAVTYSSIAISHCLCHFDIIASNRCLWNYSWLITVSSRKFTMTNLFSNTSLHPTGFMANSLAREYISIYNEAVFQLPTGIYSSFYTTPYKFSCHFSFSIFEGTLKTAQK